MRESIDTTEERFLVRRAKSFTHAFRGLKFLFSTTPNVWIHGVIFMLAVVGGVFYGITNTEWMFLLVAGGMVFAAEAFNTAIEIDMDLTSPEFHPYARDTKDVAAAAVLITSIFALLIGILIFFKYLPFYD